MSAIGPRVAAQTTTSAEIAHHLVAAGCAIVEGIIDPDWLDELRRQIDPLRQASPLGTDDFAGFKTTRTGGLVGRSEAVGLTPDLVAECDDDFLRLLGCSRTAYAHGYVDDMRNPIDYVRGRSGHQGFGDPQSAPLRLDNS